MIALAEPKAGERLLQWFLTDPRGEEVLEGTMGGLMAGGALLGSGEAPGEIALKTATAILGGIGLGMAGRKIGASIGRRVNVDEAGAPRSLKDQQGLLAMMARTAGSETTHEGLAQQGQVMKAAVQEALVNQTSARMAREAAENPTAFAQRYGITPQQFETMMPNVQAGRVAASTLQAMESMPPEQRKQLMDAILRDYEAVEKAVTSNAARGIDDNLNRVAEELGKSDEPKASEVAAFLKNFTQGSAPPVTGEHVGRAAGRFIGDELGILGGLVAGDVLAAQLGMESPQDKRIRELEAQLAGRG